MIAPTPPYEQPSPPRRTSIPGLALWLLILCLVILIVPLYLLSVTLRAQRIPQVAEMTSLSATLGSTQAPAAEEVELNESLLGTLNETRGLSDALSALRSSHINYPDVMTVLLDFAADAMQLTGVNEENGRIAISGEAASESVVRAYTDELRRQTIFRTITVQSLETLTAAPTAEAAQPAVPPNMTLAAPSSIPIRRFVPNGAYVRFTLLIELETGES